MIDSFALTVHYNASLLSLNAAEINLKYFFYEIEKYFSSYGRYLTSFEYTASELKAIKAILP